MFHVRRRPADYHPRKRKKKPLQGKWGQSNELMDYRYEDGLDRLPFFLELNPGNLLLQSDFTWGRSKLSTNGLVKFSPTVFDKNGRFHEVLSKLSRIAKRYYVNRIVFCLIWKLGVVRPQNLLASSEIPF